MRRVLCLLCAFLLISGCSLADSAGESSVSGVTYEIFPGSFRDSDGDGLGDLGGITESLDYLERLGVSRIWLTPIHPSPSYHRYDVTDYRAVDPVLGTLADFSTLVDEAGKRGISVMLDLVVNHTSKEHPWFTEACKALAEGEESPYVDWYHFTQGSGQHPVPGAEGWFYEGQFGDHMPDLNLDNPDVRAEIADIIAYWQTLGVRGFRLDAVTSYYTGADTSNADFLRFVTETAHEGDADCYVVGEAWTDAEAMLRLYTSGIDSLFNFPAADQDGRYLKSAFKGSGALCVQEIAAWQARLHATLPNSVDAPFLTNHDMGRAAGALRSDVTKEKIAAMLYLLSPGYPTVYYGEELGMTGSGRDENKRLPMLWSADSAEGMCLPPADADQTQRLKIGADVQDGDIDSLLNCYRAIIAIRKACPELVRGTMSAMDTGCEAVACYRVTDVATLQLFINASATESATVPVTGAWYMVGSYGGANFAAGAVSLPPASCMVLKLR